jgi:type IV pilus biogenesis protein CpaD/CtpE
MSMHDKSCDLAHALQGKVAEGRLWKATAAEGCPQPHQRTKDVLDVYRRKKWIPCKKTENHTDLDMIHASL